MDVASLSVSLLGTIASFCDPWDLCSLSVSCRSVNKKLNVSVVDCPFPEWKHETKNISHVQKILQLPFLYHDQPFFFRLTIKVDRLIRLFIMSHPSTNTVLDTIMDEETSQRTNVELHPMDTQGYFHGYIDCRVDPHQTYFLWAECTPTIDQRIHDSFGTMQTYHGCMDEYQAPKSMRLRLQVLKMLAWSFPSGVITTTYIQLKQLRILSTSPLLASPTGWRNPSLNNNFWLFFTKVLLLALETPGLSPIQTHLESVIQRSIDQDTTRAFMIIKIFIMVCHQLLGHHQSDIEYSVKPMSMQKFLAESRKGSFTTSFAPVRLRCQMGRYLSKRGVDKVIMNDDLVTRTTSGSDRVNVDSLLSSWYAESRTRQGLNPSNHSNYVDAKANEFALKYTFHIDRTNSSCNAYLEPITYGNDFTCCGDLEMDLSILSEGNEVCHFLLPMIEKYRTDAYTECDQPSCVKSISLLMNLFLAMIGQALVDCGAPGSQDLDAFAEGDGICSHQYGLEPSSVLYKFLIDQDTCTCHVHITRRTRCSCHFCKVCDWDIPLHDDKKEVACTLSALMSEALESFKNQHGEANFICSVSLMMYGFLRTVTQALAACQGRSSDVLDKILHKPNSSNLVSDGLDFENDLGHDDTFLACFGSHEDPNIPLCCIHIQPKKRMNYGLRDCAVSLYLQESRSNVSRVVSTLMYAYMYPFNNGEMICGLLQAMAQTMMLCHDPDYRALAKFLQDDVVAVTEDEVGILRLPSAIHTTIAGFCRLQDIYSLSCTCRSLHENLGLTRLKFSSFGWSYHFLLEHDIQELIKIPSGFAACRHYATFTIVVESPNDVRFPSLVFYIVTRPGHNDSNELIQDYFGNVATIVTQTENVAPFSRFGFEMTCEFEPSQDYFLWAKGEPSFPFVVHFDLRNVVFCHPTGSCLKQTLTAFESIRALIHEHSAVPNSECYPTSGDNDDSPLFRMFVNLFAVALDICGCSLMQRFCSSVVEVPVHEDALRALTIFLKMCQGLIGMDASSASAEESLQGKCIFSEQRLVPLPPIRFARGKRCETQLQNAFTCFVPIIPNTKRIRLSGRFSEPCGLRFAVKGQCSIHEWTVLDPTCHSAYWDNDTQAFLCSCEFDVDPDAKVCSLRGYSVGESTSLLRDLDVYLMIEDDGSAVTTLLTLLMDSFLKPFSEFDENKLSLLVFGLLEVVVRSFKGCELSVRKAAEECLKAQGVSPDCWGLRFLLDSISLTSTENARYEGTRVPGACFYYVQCPPPIIFATPRIKSWDPSSRVLNAMGPPPSTHFYSYFRDVTRQSLNYD